MVWSHASLADREAIDVGVRVRALTAFAARNEADCFVLLEKAVHERDPMAALVIGHTPILDGVRGRDEFRAVIELMGWAEAMPIATLMDTVASSRSWLLLVIVTNWLSEVKAKLGMK